MEKVKFVAFISILFCLLIVIPASFAVDNETVIAISDDAQNSTLSSIQEDVLSTDYYYNASVENDTGNGSIINPYKNLKSDRIQSNSVIHLADGEYNLDYSKTTDNLTIIGQNVEQTIITYHGLGFYVKNSLTLKNVTLVNLGIRDISPSIINANNVIFKNSKFSSIISNNESTKINLTNCTFLNNTASSGFGGAIYITAGILNIDNSLFADNYVSLYGGAIAIVTNNAKVTIKKSKFINDYSTSAAGGAIFIKDSQRLICQDSIFTNCTATFGAAITSLSSNITVSNITAKNNKARYDGGVLYAMYSLISINNSIFYNNSAKNGGALYIDDISFLKICNNNFTNNNASHTAGAVYSVLNRISILNATLNNTFRNNTALYENDVYESEGINLTIGSNDYILIRSDPAFNGTLPNKYDLRDDKYVTPVKDQGSNGNCWAFAAMSSLESCLLKITGTSYDLSEANMKNVMSLFSDYGWDMTPNTGGYDKMGYGYLVSWLGPVNENDDPYIIGAVLSPVLNSIYHIQNVLFLERKSYTDNDAIKKAILQYGAVSTCIYWSSSYLKNNYNYYYNGPDDGDIGANHAVAIVGWDDNYSRSNFKSTPEGDGAWIIKNSWGTGSGQKGYYYVSYYDKFLAKPGKLDSTYVFLFNDSIKYDKNYQYDIAGKTDYFLNFTSTVWYKDKFVSTDNEFLSAVSTYFMKETDWELAIYVNNVLKHTQSGHSPHSYSTIELSKFIQLNVGDAFEIVFKITVDGDAGVPISEAVSLNHEIYSEDTSFISYDGVNWKDLYDLSWAYPGHHYDSQVACIKAFTILNPVSTTINLTVENPDNPCLIKAVVLNQYGNPVLFGNVTLNVEGNDYVVEIVDGVASLCHIFKNIGDNLITASFEKTGFTNSFSQKTVTITKGNVGISLNIKVDVFDAQINVNLSKPINETVYVMVDQSTHKVNVINGIGKLVLTNLYYGTHDVKAYIITDYYNCNNATDSFRIIYLNTFIQANDVTIYYNQNFVYSIKLVDKNNNPIVDKIIKFTIGDTTKQAITNDKGIASVKFNLNPGNYKINILCPKEEQYLKSEAIKNIKIKSTITLTSVLTYTYNSNYVSNLVDSSGKKLVNKKVTLLIGSKAYNLITDANGKLKYNIKLSPGSYKLTVKNLATGEAKTQTIKVVKRITQNSNLVMYYGAGKSYKVKVFDNNGKIAKGVKVTFTINKVKYIRTTNNKGYAYMKINLKPGTYKIIAEYKGFKVSNNIVVKKTIITKDITVKKGKTIKFTAKLLNSKGKILKNKNIKFKFKSKTYQIKTNKKGIATLKIKNKYKKGKYAIKTIHGGLQIKNKISIK